MAEALILKDNKFGLIFMPDGEREKKRYIKSKSDLENNEDIQNLLKDFRAADSSNRKRIKCLCKPDKDLYLSARQKSNGKYYIQNFGTNDAHDLRCPFYKGEKLFYDEERGYSSKIYEDTEETTTSNSNAHHIEDIIQTRRNLTYNNFCRDLIEAAVISSFNQANEGRKNREELENFSSDLFFKTLQIKINEATKKTKLPKGHDLVFGVIKENNLFLDKLNDKEENENTVVTIEKYTDYNDIGLESKNYSITKRRLSITKKLIMNFDKITKPLYFFIGVSQKGEKAIKGKQKHKKPHLKRLFIHPIYYDSQNISFVESDYERLYAKRLFENKIAFLKPMSGNELYQITRELRNYHYFDKTDQQEKTKPPYLKYRPDFIEFHKDFLTLVEVSGYDDKAYLDHLEVKAKYYKKLEEILGIIRYKEVKGKDL